MRKNNNRRKNIRVSFEIPVGVTTDAGGRSRTLEGVLSNISLKGLFIILTNHRVPLDTECNIMIPLGDQNCPQMVLDGVVVRQDDEGIGVQLGNVDTESLIHLKQIIFHNSPDPDLIDRELLERNE